MPASDKRSPPTDTAGHTVLDPRTLGRPVHLLPRFTQRLSESLGELFRQYNRRYRAQYQLGPISVKPPSPASKRAAVGRWQVSETALGRVACLIERPLVLSLMAHRYGAATGELQVLTADSAPETATEERLQQLLSQQLLERALALIAEPVALNLQTSQQPQLHTGSWYIQVPVRESTQDLEAELLLALDPQYIDLLLKQLAEGQVPRGASPLPDAEQLPRQLTLKLEARLLEQTLPLGELLALRPGDLVPVRLKATEVLVDGSRLFTASVAEHQGKLCLTSFADAE